MGLPLVYDLAFGTHGCSEGSRSICVKSHSQGGGGVFFSCLCLRRLWAIQNKSELERVLRQAAHFPAYCDLHAAVIWNITKIQSSVPCSWSTFPVNFLISIHTFSHYFARNRNKQIKACYHITSLAEVNGRGNVSWPKNITSHNATRVYDSANWKSMLVWRFKIGWGQAVCHHFLFIYRANGFVTRHIFKNIVRQQLGREALNISTCDLSEVFMHTCSLNWANMMSFIL